MISHFESTYSILRLLYQIKVDRFVSNLYQIYDKVMSMKEYIFFMYIILGNERERGREKIKM